MEFSEEYEAIHATKTPPAQQRTGEGNWASALVGLVFPPPVHQMLPVRHRTPEHESRSELGVHTWLLPYLFCLEWHLSWRREQSSVSS